MGRGTLSISDVLFVYLRPGEQAVVISNDIPENAIIVGSIHNPLHCVVELIIDSPDICDGAVLRGPVMQTIKGCKMTDIDENFQTGVFCRHWSVDGDCKELCANCGHRCPQHDDDCCRMDGCDCGEWKDEHDEAKSG